MSKSVILTGLRANNDLTIGNYFGGILPIIDMAKTKSDEYQINMFIPDLHSFTTPIDHSTLHDQIMHNARLFTAAGLPLDNDSISLYRQSYISAHSELTWILDCFVGVGEMQRMTQFKDKSGSIGSDRVSVGLFNYPVLMAADILLYNTQYVPVGEDQTQHLEFTRDIAQRINSKFGDVFTVPETVKRHHEFFGKDQGLRIKDLIDPTKKMSKSDESGRGVIFLGDTPEAAHKKIMSATTDDKAEIHFDRENQPGISNLLEILALLRGGDLQQTIGEFEGQTRYGDFKKVVADEVAAFLTDFQQKLASVDDNAILAKLQRSEEVMSITANATLQRAQQAVGLRAKV
jgi:tryptophanyl-tRNA synthetase